MNYQGAAMQDQFAANILNFKRDGYYLDIGSCDAISCNNTFVFESLGWKGICIELDATHNYSYRQRKCNYFNQDALQIYYKDLFEKCNMNYVIDYLSLDVDEASLQVLASLPLTDYIFQVITIEHDAYIHGDRYRQQQRQILTDAGYVLVCRDVLVPIQADTKPDCPFEDWWVHPRMNPPAKLFCSNLYPQQIIDKFKT